VSHAGATPIPIEPDERTYNLNPRHIEPTITMVGATLKSRGNNTVNGNTTNTSGTITALAAT